MKNLSLEKFSKIVDAVVRSNGGISWTYTTIFLQAIGIFKYI